MAEPEPSVVANAIELCNVTKSFGDLRAVDNLSATISRGEVVGLIGPNGSGKTTLLRLLAGLAYPTSGSLTVLDKDPRDEAVRRSIGIVGSRFPAVPRRTGRATLRHIARLRQRPDLGQASELAERLDLDLDRTASELSRGNLQKLALVQAFMHEPELVLLDEPTVGLDPVVQQAFDRLIQEKNAQGTTVIMSSHVLGAVRAVATELFAIRDGSVVVQGPIDSVLAASGRTVTVRMAQAENGWILDQLVDPVVTPPTAHYAGPEVIVTGRFHGDVNVLIRSLATRDIVDVTIDAPRLDDLIDDLYRGGRAR